MNFEAPSQVRGKVTRWRFCYYGDFRQFYRDSDVHGAIFMVYRRESPSSDNYIAVPSSITSKTLEWREIKDESFGCLVDEIQPRYQFEIRENDIVGACIWDYCSIHPLLLTGTSVLVNSLTYQLDINPYDDCMYSQFESVDTTNSLFRLRQTAILHLYAEIGKKKHHFPIFGS